jgi:hypothetical protein
VALPRMPAISYLPGDLMDVAIENVFAVLCTSD